jgi:hypothetical protein
VLNYSYIFAKLIGAFSSWLDAANLRNRVYELKEENEIMKTALEDLKRMDKGRSTGEYAEKVLRQLDK